MKETELHKLLENLVCQPSETEWIEFKVDYQTPEIIGERLSALANGACLQNQKYGYLIFGVEDKAHSIVGTNFKPMTTKKGNEEIGKALRKTVRMYPELAIRELVANALIHQDLYERGSAPVVEIFSDRIEITNPGTPLITTMRFIDEYQSRNEKLASLMRRVGICEEQGSGIDKVIFQVEVFQLPAPEFMATEKHTKVILYAYQKLSDMNRKDRIRACYQH